MLYAEAGSYHYKLLLLNCMVPGFLPCWNVEEGISEALIIVTTYYYTMLQQLLLHCYFMLYINYCCRDPRYAYVIPIITQSHGEPRAVPTCLSGQGQAQNTLGKHRT